MIKGTCVFVKADVWLIFFFLYALFQPKLLCFSVVSMHSCLRWWRNELNMYLLLQPSLKITLIRVTSSTYTQTRWQPSFLVFFSGTITLLISSFPLTSLLTMSPFAYPTHIPFDGGRTDVFFFFFFLFLHQGQLQEHRIIES